MQNSCGSLLLPPNPPQGGEKRLFLGLEMGLFLRFFAQESFMHTTLRTTRHGLRPVAAQPSRAWWWWWGVSAALLRCCGWKRKWWWLRRQLVCAVVSVSTRSPRAASLHAGLCLRHGVHTQARPQAGASRCSAFQERRGGAIAQRRERGGGRCGSHPRQLHNCRPELEPDSEWRTSRLVPAAGQPVPISMSRHRPHQLPRRSAQP